MLQNLKPIEIETKTEYYGSKINWHISEIRKFFCNAGTQSKQFCCINSFLDTPWRTFHSPVIDIDTVFHIYYKGVFYYEDSIFKWRSCQSGIPIYFL